MRYTCLHDGYGTNLIRNSAACVYTLSAAFYHLMRFQLGLMDMVPNTANVTNPLPALICNKGTGQAGFPPCLVPFYRLFLIGFLQKDILADT